MQSAGAVLVEGIEASWAGQGSRGEAQQYRDGLAVICGLLTQLPGFLVQLRKSAVFLSNIFC